MLRERPLAYSSPFSTSLTVVEAPSSPAINVARGDRRKVPYSTILTFFTESAAVDSRRLSKRPSLVAIARQSSFMNVRSLTPGAAGTVDGCQPSDDRDHRVTDCECVIE